MVACRAMRIALVCGFLLSAMSRAFAAPPAQQPAPAAKPADLPPEGYRWLPQLSSQGPVTLIVSLSEQRAYVYRNGIRIGVSKVSTGKPGFETPTGVFSILQKRREHYSNLYDNAPMPFMQRLTWDGVALHAGRTPDYPASHGCIRLPYAFSEVLFSVTVRGMTVVVTDAEITPSTASPGLFAPFAAALGTLAEGPTMPASTPPYRWQPERALDGPIAVLLSAADNEVRVLRNAVEIGRAPVTLAADAVKGTRVYVLLDGTEAGASTLVPDRPPLRWLQVPLIDRGVLPVNLRAIAASGQLRVDPGFARLVYDALAPGTTMVVTDQPLRSITAGDLPIFEAEQPEPGVPPVMH